MGKEKFSLIKMVVYKNSYYFREKIIAMSLPLAFLKAFYQDISSQKTEAILTSKVKAWKNKV